jgi:hypothetical protein
MHIGLLHSKVGGLSPASFSDALPGCFSDFTSTCTRECGTRIHSQHMNAQNCSHYTVAQYLSTNAQAVVARRRVDVVVLSESNATTIGCAPDLLLPKARRAFQPSPTNAPMCRAIPRVCDWPTGRAKRLERNPRPYRSVETISMNNPASAGDDCVILVRKHTRRGVSLMGNSTLRTPQWSVGVKWMRMLSGASVICSRCHVD